MLLGLFGVLCIVGLNRLDGHRSHVVLDRINDIAHVGQEGRALVGGHNADAGQDKLVEHRQYIRDNGIDLPEVRNWRWEDSEAPAAE